MDKMMKLIIPILFFIFMAGGANAAQVYFDPQLTTYKVGDSFTVSVVLDTEGQPINAVEINILAPELLKIKNISKRGSVIQLWVSEPSFSGKVINLTGGIPGGTTTSKGTIAKITFEAAAVGEGNIVFLSNSSILINDGLGTKLDITTVGGPVFQIVPRPKETVTAPPKPEKTPVEIKEEGEKDKKKPERFEILFGKDPRVFGGERFISFFTTDEGSGLEHYEVKLGRGPYKIAQSPYLIKDIPPRTVIMVRAYDGTGNYRESVYPGIIKRFWWAILNIF